MSSSRFRWIAFLLTGDACFLAVLLVVPPLNRVAAFLAIFLQEKSLWFLVLSAAALAATIRFTRGRIRGGLAGLSLLTGCVFAWPTYEALRLARAAGIGLSVERYVRSEVEGRGDAPAAETTVFARVSGQDLKLDVYRTPRAQHQRALIVIHGGGWSSGNRSELPLTNAFFRDHGLVVFDIEYRLDPAPNGLIAVGDVKCAIGWVRAHAEEWGVDPNRITLLGRSAGGHLALLAAYTPNEPRLPASCPVGDTSVDSVVAMYPPVDLVWGHAHPNNEAVYDGVHRLERFLGGTPTTVPERYALQSPLSHLGPSSPPTLTVHGEADAFVSPQHSRFLEERLRALNVRHRAVFIPYAQHGFDYVHGGWSSQLAEAETLALIQSLGGAQLATPTP